MGRLLRRSLDDRRIRDRRWYLPIVLLGPGIHGLTYALLRATGTPVPDPGFPALGTAVALVAFLAAALGEEVGWSGYALDPLQERGSALTAGPTLGAVWAIWHLVPLVQAGRAAGWIAWWAFGTVGFRVLLTWIYDNSGKSVVAVALAHALTNLAWIGPSLDFVDDGYPYAGVRLSALLLTGAAAVVTLLWGPRTLTR